MIFLWWKNKGNKRRNHFSLWNYKVRCLKAFFYLFFWLCLLSWKWQKINHFFKKCQCLQWNKRKWNNTRVFDVTAFNSITNVRCAKEKCVFVFYAYTLRQHVQHKHAIPIETNALLFVLLFGDFVKHSSLDSPSMWNEIKEDINSREN